MVQEDLLAQYIDGKLSEEEAEAVLDALSKDEESLLEWRQSLIASSLVDSKAPTKVSIHRAAGFVSRHIGEKNNSFSGLVWGLSLAIVASIAVAVIVFAPKQPNTLPESIVADSIEQNEAKEHSSSSGESELAPMQIAGTSTAGVHTVFPEAIEQDEVSTAAAGIRRSVAMIHPSKADYSVRVVNPSRSFVFRWEMVGAREAKIEVLDKNGERLVCEQGPNLTELSVPATDLLDASPVSWLLKVTFNDGSTQDQSGIVSFTRAE